MVYFLISFSFFFFVNNNGINRSVVLALHSIFFFSISFPHQTYLVNQKREEKKLLTPSPSFTNFAKPKLHRIPNDIIKPSIAIIDTVYRALKPQISARTYLSMCRSGGRSTSSNDVGESKSPPPTLS